MNKFKVLIIQNTSYHFEVVLSLYASLLRLGFDTLDVIQTGPNNTEQENFLLQNNVSLITSDSDLSNYHVAFIISVYPSVLTKRKKSIPDFESRIIQHFIKRRNNINICHRFGCPRDFNGYYITKKNTLFLSMLAKLSNLDFFCPVESIVKPKLYESSGLVLSCVQGNFHLKNRTIKEEILNKFFLNSKIIFMGNSLSEVNKISSNDYYEKLNEVEFYEKLNSVKFLLCMIDDKIKEASYVKNRFSTNFQHAVSLEKPIFCHEVFKPIYDIPGIYYNDFNINDKFEQLISISCNDYLKLVDDIKDYKNKYINHNNSILIQKIDEVVNDIS
jgi:hypothetical protein